MRKWTLREVKCDISPEDRQTLSVNPGGVPPEPSFFPLSLGELAAGEGRSFLEADPRQ